ncbi:D-serine deaminase-like pyridoxal phosphate-dependent protein [Actinoplanes campanulatus]|uniref:D-serine deaminase-like pyridoxal phosphate-dependent protein n=1 Tax=Actinoplanes campanulatus TaxID=113559 RepID=A0A7W5A9W8_9ACTN|nr:alanine racemase [Actinoplanes campanulatus]MBB3092402.1 D-serine deaminase-like pyridoxal phosphate-dependent protein [Actinoplanes campanulatus]GGN47703.1 amino acid deaminase [Actinoplanes campanulatus]GID34504.1 amino acid deaminase [Actinoplanes campanulatus]
MTIDWRSKGFWAPDEARDPARLAAERPGIFDGGFTWPLLVVRRDAVEANIATMAAYCRRHGLDFAPHAKTTMAPRLLDAQLRAGAWGMTVATPHQALVMRRLGVERVLIANEILDPTALRWLAAESAAGWEVYFQVDSLAGVAAAAATGGPLRVLVELGHAGGRTGVRTLDEMETVARAVAAAPGLELAGVTGYEGQLPDQDGVDAFLDHLVAGVARLSGAGLLPERGIVSAGGSAWFDRVADKLAGLDVAARLVLRSGASVTHDDGFYRERTPFVRVPDEGPLAAALEIWAQVLSAPEPGLALAGMGKRDAPFDEGLPVPLEIRRPDGVVESAEGLRVTKLNDHHTYLQVEGAVLEPGDLIRFGISHPCTAFDKWRDIPVVDEQRRVVDVLHTYF